MSAVVTTDNGPLLSFIERASRDENFDVQKFGELLKLQRDIEHDRAKRAFNIAMSEAQSEMLPVVRDAKNSHLGNRYAKLETIDAAMRPIYTARGFSVRYGSAPAPFEGGIRITCTVAHSGGYFEESYLDSPISSAGSQGGRSATTPVQAIGSAITYLRRYLLSMAFNVVLADEDDDGEAARRPAAASRMARMEKLAPTYDTPQPPVESPPPAKPAPTAPQRTTAQWQTWLERLREAGATAPTRQAVVDIGGRATVTEALATAPDWVKDDIRDLLTDAYARFPEEDVVAELEAEASADWPGPDPEKMQA